VSKFTHFFMVADNLTGAFLIRANLFMADLSDAAVYESNLDGANIEGICLDSTLGLESTKESTLE
jgi:uncharacterized protein YjbI with pentapeptide repeats